MNSQAQRSLRWSTYCRCPPLEAHWRTVLYNIALTRCKCLLSTLILERNCKIENSRRGTCDQRIAIYEFKRKDRHSRVNIFMKYTLGIARIFDLGEVAVFRTAKSAASAAATRAADVVVKVPIQRDHDITDGSWRIIWGTETLLNKYTLTLTEVDCVMTHRVSFFNTLAADVSSTIYLTYDPDYIRQ